ncbi:DNA alkylation repair enzyme [Aquimixticola soesokkakensis]|uniref:DNA alkylation repair enzyme n=1 Tax=Aquimixticola soesokkakensis TaxID=1519096 RepID=A0A1Y5S4B0_9RHOB|nr:DNA alkylation repair protein [Aquimixticola soesokkakensis]SLN30923.1 DNA alkylation repair enzyme [Aquimixticola soesokkakensis]
MTPNDALEALRAASDPDRAAQLATRHGDGTYLGTPAQTISDLAGAWRKTLDLTARLELAQGLWESAVFEARIAAAKLLTQARIPEDQALWDQILAWLPQAGLWPVLDALAAAGARRLAARPDRLSDVLPLASAEAPLLRRAALLLTEPMAKADFPDADALIRREQVLGLLPALLADSDKDVHRTAQSWLRTFAKHDFKRARAFRQDHGLA